MTSPTATPGTLAGKTIAMLTEADAETILRYRNELDPQTGAPRSHTDAAAHFGLQAYISQHLSSIAVRGGIAGLKLTRMDETRVGSAPYNRYRIERTAAFDPARKISGTAYNALRTEPAPSTAAPSTLVTTHGDRLSTVDQATADRYRIGATPLSRMTDQDRYTILSWYHHDDLAVGRVHNRTEVALHFKMKVDDVDRLHFRVLHHERGYEGLTLKRQGHDRWRVIFTPEETPAPVPTAAPDPAPVRPTIPAGQQIALVPPVVLAPPVAMPETTKTPAATENGQPGFMALLNELDTRQKDRLTERARHEAEMQRLGERITTIKGLLAADTLYQSVRTKVLDLETSNDD